jgi:hypothetical protein
MRGGESQGNPTTLKLHRTGPLIMIENLNCWGNSRGWVAGLRIW